MELLKSVSGYELVVYSIILLTNIVLAWQCAKHGLLEIGILRPPNKAVINSLIIGMITIFVASYLEKNGHADFILFKKESYLLAGLFSIGVPLFTYIVGRYVVLPHGVPEYNRARARINFWTMKNFRPGTRLNDEAKMLAEFPRAQNTLNLLDKAIKLQRQGSRAGFATTALPINQDAVDWDGCMMAPCPNCGMSSKAPIRAEQGNGHCTFCSCSLGFKVVGDMVHMTAFGPGVRGRVTVHNRMNVAVALGEKGLLLRMMHRFAEAKGSLEGALSEVDAISSDPLVDERETVATKSTIVYRMGELAHITGRKEEAISLYKQSLELDKQIGNTTDLLLIEGLISNVNESN